MTDTPIELPLVVVKFLRRWCQRILDLRILRVVLLHQIAHPGLHLEHALLQLQFPCLCCVWLVDGHGGVLDGVRICEEDIPVSRNLKNLFCEIIPLTLPFVQ